MIDASELAFQVSNNFECYRISCSYDCKLITYMYDLMVSNGSLSKVLFDRTPPILVLRLLSICSVS